MLKLRILTAACLLLLLIPPLLYPPLWAWRSVTLVLLAAAGWEWGRLNGLGQLGAWMSAFACLLACVMAWDLGLADRPMTGFWVAAGSAWILLGAALLKAGVASWSKLPQPVRLLGGLLAVWLTWLAAAQAHRIGAGFLISVMALVWAADIGAYFAGRKWGGRWVASKLAPSISPGKTWEGVLGGLVCVVAVTFVWRGLELSGMVPGSSFMAHLSVGGGVFLMVLSLLLITGMSVVGDLVESLVKRSAGVKDSSCLLPGHGGVLDRIDALLPTLPLAMMLFALSAR